MRHTAPLWFVPLWFVPLWFAVSASPAAADDLPTAEIRECNSGQLTLGPFTGADGKSPQTPETIGVSLDVPLPSVRSTPQPPVHLWTGAFTNTDVGACPTPYPTASVCLTTTVSPWAFQAVPAGADTHALATYRWTWHDLAGAPQQGQRWQAVLIHARLVNVMGCPTPTPTPTP